MYKVMMLIRGPQGAGKSTLAANICDGLTVIGTKNVAWEEADTYFRNENGEYCFDANKLTEAHKKCYDYIQDAAEKQIPNLIVSNTSTTEWEVRPYRLLAEKHGYVVQEIFVLPNGTFKSEHDIPESTYKRTLTRFGHLLCQVGRKLLSIEEK